jgi:hypothetical protein
VIWKSIHDHVGLVVTFGVFLAFIFAFARVYLCLYLSDKANFSFDADVSSRQADVHMERMHNQAAELHQRIIEKAMQVSILTEVLETLESALTRLEDDGSTFHALQLPSGRRCEARCFTAPQQYPSPELDEFYYLALFDVGGKSLGTRMTDADSFSDIQRALPDVIANAQIEESRLLEKARAKAPSTMWSFWDFFYFSTITQTTVGYGDILPNSTIVRMIVSLQIFVGYALLVVVLNIVLSH